MLLSRAEELYLSLWIGLNVGDGAAVAVNSLLQSA
jgi:hypothetical protein